MKNLIIAIISCLAIILVSLSANQRDKNLAQLLVKSADGADSSSSGSLLDYLSTHFSNEQTWDYCWMNAPYFLANPTPAAPSRIKLSLFEPVITASWQPVIWQLDTFDAEGRHLGRGGDSLNIAVHGPALLHPHIYDLRNGTYLALFFAVDAGAYTAEISMRWQACRAYAFCNVEDTHQPIDPIAQTLHFTVVVNSDDDDDGVLPRALQNSGRWVVHSQHDDENNKNNSVREAPVVHPLLSGPYIWRPYSTEQPVLHFPTDRLHGRWIYFIGDSLSEHGFNDMVATVFAPLCSSEEDAAAEYDDYEEESGPVHLLIDRYNGKVMKEQYKRDGMQLYHCAVLNLTFSFVFYPDSFPVGGFKNTRFPLVNESTNSIAAAANVTFKVPDWNRYLRGAMQRHPSIPSHTHPDAIIFNFGLHYATPMDPPLYRVLMRHFFMRLREEFPFADATNTESGESTTKILWRSSAWTHFEQEQLAVKWNCRTPVRTLIMNEISDQVADAFGVDAVVDFQALTAARSDATPDNRHFSDGNVRATYANILLNTLHQLFGGGGGGGGGNG